MHVVPVTTPAELDAALAVRFEVFVDEQGVDPDSERDHLDDDPRTFHVLVIAEDGDAARGEALAPGTVLATGRLLAPHTDSFHGEGSGHGSMSPAHPHIGRVAVRVAARGSGAGKAVMDALHAAALERHGVAGSVRVELSAQDQAMPFYERLGYTSYGEGYLDEGIWHHDAYVVVRR